MERWIMQQESKNDDKDSRVERHERIRKAYERSGLNYNQLCILLGVKRDTLAHWLANAAIRVPPEYVVTLIEDKVDDYLKNPYNLNTIANREVTAQPWWKEE